MAVLGRGWGSAILAADTLKGVAACVAGGWLAGPVGAHVAGTAAVVGHCFPVWNGFRGGKGVAVSLGQCLATFPAYLPIDLAVAWGVGRWSGRALPGTAAASATWVAAGTLWAARRWPNLWGPAAEPGPPPRVGGQQRGDPLPLRHRPAAGAGAPTGAGPEPMPPIRRAP